MRSLQRIYEFFNPKPSSLVEKLAQACDAVPGVGKFGESPDGYKFQRYADVAVAVRHELFSRRIVIIPREWEIVQSWSFETNGGEQGTEILIKQRYALTDGRETQLGFGMGVGRDTKGKALYMAQTGALKYFLRTLGLIPDVEDDPEMVADQSQDDAELARLRPDLAAKIADQTAPPEKIIRAWNSLCKKHGKTVRQRRDYLFLHFGVKTFFELRSRADADRAIRWAANREELKATLDTSLEAAAQPVVELLDQEPAA